MRVGIGVPRNGLILTEGRLETMRGDPDALSDDVLRETMRTLDDPVAEILLDVAGPRGRRRVTFAVGDRLATVIMSRPERPAELAAVTPDSVPAVIARTVRLGPAPATDDPVSTVPLGDIEALTAPPHRVSRALAVSPVNRALATGWWNLWSVQASALDDAHEAVGVRMDVIGAAGHGWWLLDDDDDSVTLTSARASDLWSLLCGLPTAPAIAPATASAASSERGFREKIG